MFDPTQTEVITAVQANSIFPKAGLHWPKGVTGASSGRAIQPMGGNMRRVKHVVDAVFHYNRLFKQGDRNRVVERKDVDACLARLVDNARDLIPTLYRPQQSINEFFLAVKTKTGFFTRYMSLTNMTQVMFEVIKARALFKETHKKDKHEDGVISATAEAVDAFMRDLDDHLQGRKFEVVAEHATGQKEVLVSGFVSKIFESDMGEALNHWRVAEVSEVLLDGTSRLTIRPETELDKAKDDEALLAEAMESINDMDIDTGDGPQDLPEKKSEEQKKADAEFKPYLGPDDDDEDMDYDPEMVGKW